MLFYVLLIGLVVFAWPTQWGGRTTYIVVRGTSMQPNFHTGDIVIARATDDHQVGDILVYAVPDGSTGAGKLIMHRLIAIRPDGTYVIQGDNRDTPDQFKIGPENVVGEERWHIPKVGMVMNLLSQWWLLAGLIGLFAFIKLWPDDSPVSTDAPDSTDALDSTEDGAAAADDSPVVATREPAEGDDVTRERPELTGRHPRPHVIVDGDGLASARWPDAALDDRRQWAVDAAGEIAKRFGTVAAVVVDDGAVGLAGSMHALVELAASDATVAAAVLGHVDEQPVAATMLIVTDQRDIAEVVWARGGSVMRCAAWLALGEGVGAVVHRADA